MNTTYQGAPKAGPQTVYVLPVLVADLPDEVRANVDDSIGAAEVVYAVHRDTGERLALVGDRKLAFLLAFQNDMVPVNAH